MLRRIYEVIAPSMRSNSKFYSPDAIEEALKAYELNQFREWGQPLLFFVFAYDIPLGKLVGTGFLKDRKFDDVDPQTKSAYLFGGFVDPDYHRHGIGTQILERRIQHARETGIEVLRANASEASLNMHIRMGAREIGRYQDPLLKSELHILEYRL